MITVVIQDEDLKSEFAQKVAQAQRPREMLLVCGREVGNQLKKHFQGLDQTRANKLNPGRREHFWAQIGESVGNPQEEGAMTVSVTIRDRRFAQKLYGGTITPKNADALTIPESPEAYGRTAGTFEAETGLKLFVVKIGGTKANDFENAILAAHENGKSGFTVEYLLTKSVTQQADADALPDMRLLETAILARADSFLSHQSPEESQ